MRYAFFALFLLAVLLVSLTGQRGKLHTERALRLFPDMDEQQILHEQGSSEIFADGLASRRPVQNTIPMGYDGSGHAVMASELEFTGYAKTGYYQTGKFGENYGQGMPPNLGLDETSVQAFLQRGQQRYDIHCAICHGAAGDGKGVAAQPGRINNVANLLEERFQLAEYPDGQVFDVISNGKGLMVSYGDKITLRDRWAIVAYVRALQEADNPESFVEGIREKLANEQVEEEIVADESTEPTQEAVSDVAPEAPPEEPVEELSGSDESPVEVVEQESLPAELPEAEPAPESVPLSDSQANSLPVLPGATAPATP